MRTPSVFLTSLAISLAAHAWGLVQTTAPARAPQTDQPVRIKLTTTMVREVGPTPPTTPPEDVVIVSPEKERASPTPKQNSAGVGSAAKPKPYKKSAPKTLSSSLSTLRRVLGSPAVDGSGPRVAALGTQVAAAEVDSACRKTFGGIGVNFPYIRNNQIFPVSSAHPAYPGFKAGLRVGDLVYAPDEILGEVGTEVSLYQIRVISAAAGIGEAYAVINRDFDPGLLTADSEAAVEEEARRVISRHTRQAVLAVHRVTLTRAMICVN